MWIDRVLPAKADGQLAELYQKIAGARGGVADIHQAQSLNPRVMAAHFELYKAIMFQASPLTRADRERLAVEVSQANGCEYCAAHHGAALQQLDEDPQLPPMVFEWARRLAREPEAASAEDIARLRHAGLSDRAILDAVLTVAYFSFANRLVQALGLDLEPGFEETCRPVVTDAGEPA